MHVAAPPQTLISHARKSSDRMTSSRRFVQQGAEGLSRKARLLLGSRMGSYLACQSWVTDWQLEGSNIIRASWRGDLELLDGRAVRTTTAAPMSTTLGALFLFPFRIYRKPGNPTHCQNFPDQEALVTPTPQHSFRPIKAACRERRRSRSPSDPPHMEGSTNEHHSSSKTIALSARFLMLIGFEATEPGRGRRPRRIIYVEGIWTRSWGKVVGKLAPNLILICSDDHSSDGYKVQASQTLESILTQQVFSSFASQPFVTNYTPTPNIKMVAKSLAAVLFALATLTPALAAPNLKARGHDDYEYSSTECEETPTYYTSSSCEETPTYYYYKSSSSCEETPTYESSSCEETPTYESSSCEETPYYPPYYPTTSSCDYESSSSSEYCYPTTVTEYSWYTSYETVTYCETSYETTTYCEYISVPYTEEIVSTYCVTETETVPEYETITSWYPYTTTESYEVTYYETYPAETVTEYQYVYNTATEYSTVYSEYTEVETETVSYTGETTPTETSTLPYCTDEYGCITLYLDCGYFVLTPGTDCYYTPTSSSSYECTDCYYTSTSSSSSECTDCYYTPTYTSSYECTECTEHSTPTYSSEECTECTEYSTPTYSSEECTECDTKPTGGSGSW
ncbi:hypothetical protein G7K_1760-t1 [Saitoella complicata NRRL Y-17804]|uniref:Uncharacterized protein n=2 Tax=Saitoella complicata (strain BCRC 22490 / CBS 7301 / JCM 7358 / NBRC 10748 / NRRL Y-17804) TaxID=698492 RepID=A0A0E9NDS0_SAICN|nr:hypothetical protein G7K_1760-t1 [Saitoella complicata NRRL Y-17804]